MQQKDWIVYGIIGVVAIVSLLGLSNPKAVIDSTKVDVNAIAQAVLNEVQKNLPTLGASAGPLYTEMQEFAGGVRRQSYVATTTTDTAMTLGWNVIENRDLISVMPLTGDLTYTLAASSTAGRFLPLAGMTQETCFWNATTTAGVELVFAAGVGVDLEVASSSATALGSLRIGPESAGCFTFFRQTATTTSFDISALYTAFEDAD